MTLLFSTASVARVVGEHIAGHFKNEKYIGDAILQKTYTVDCISKKRQVNTGELPKYYVTGCHEGIIDRDIFNMVQEEIARRSGKQKVSQKKTKTENGKHSGKYALSGLLVCDECGAHYRRSTWARNGQKRIVWRCISRLEFGTKYCKGSPTIDEDLLHTAILKAMSTLIENKDELIASTKEFLRSTLEGGNDGVVDKSVLETQIRELQSEMVGLVDKCVKTSTGADAYDEQFKTLSDKINALQAKLDVVGSQGSGADNSRLNDIIAVIESKDFDILHYDDSLMRLLVEKNMVTSPEKLEIRLKELGVVDVQL